MVRGHENVFLLTLLRCRSSRSGKSIGTTPAASINSLKTINTLLGTPRHNFFSLVRGPSHSPLDPWCTTPPVSSFETGFKDFTREQLRNFVAERLQTAPQGTNLGPDQYALLDERSAGDNTVVLSIACSSLHDRDPETMDEAELEQWEEECEDNPNPRKDVWREFRVKFHDAEKLSTDLTMENDFTQKLYNDDFVAEHTDDQGIFKLQRAYEAFVDSNIGDGEEDEE